MSIEHDLRRLADAAERIAAALEGASAGPAQPAPLPAQSLRTDPTAEAADILRHAEHLAIVTALFPQWRNGKPPSVRAIMRAIDLVRRASGSGEFASNDVAHTVQRKLLRLRERPELLALIKIESDSKS